MRKQGFKDEVKLAAWHTQMQSIFPDVKNGSVLTAVVNANQETSFYDGNQLLGTIKGNDFAKWFFWHLAQPPNFGAGFAQTATGIVMKAMAITKTQLIQYGLLGMPVAFAGFPLYVLAPDYYATQHGLSLALLGFILLALRIFDAVPRPVDWFF